MATTSEHLLAMAVDAAEQLSRTHDPPTRLFCIGVSLMWLASIGGAWLDSVDGKVCVFVGPDAIVGRRAISGHEDLLRRLGWEVAEVEHSYQPLRLVRR